MYWQLIGSEKCLLCEQPAKFKGEGMKTYYACCPEHGEVAVKGILIADDRHIQVNLGNGSDTMSYNEYKQHRESTVKA